MIPCRACGDNPGGECPACRKPRRPVAGWAYDRRGDLWCLHAGTFKAQVYQRQSDGRWVYVVNGRGVEFTLEAAQLAAEDALLEEILAAAAVLGYKVGP